MFRHPGRSVPSPRAVQSARTVLPFYPNIVFICLLRSFTVASPRSRRRKLCLHRFRASTKAHPARCSSSPHKIFDFAGAPNNAQSYPVRTAIQLSRIIYLNRHMTVYSFYVLCCRKNIPPLFGQKTGKK